MPEGRIQIHPGFAQSVPSAFLTHLPLKIQGRVSIPAASLSMDLAAFVLDSTFALDIANRNLLRGHAVN